MAPKAPARLSKQQAKAAKSWQNFCYVASASTVNDFMRQNPDRALHVQQFVQSSMHAPIAAASSTDRRFCRGRTYLRCVPPSNFIELWQFLPGGDTVTAEQWWKLHRKYQYLFLEMLEALTQSDRDEKIADALDRRVEVFKKLVRYKLHRLGDHVWENH